MNGLFYYSKWSSLVVQVFMQYYVLASADVAQCGNTFAPFSWGLQFDPRWRHRVIELLWPYKARGQHVKTHKGNLSKSKCAALDKPLVKLSLRKVLSHPPYSCHCPFSRWCFDVIARTCPLSVYSSSSPCIPCIIKLISNMYWVNVVSADRESHERN